MPYTVYIIYSPSLDKFYIGFTGDDIGIRLKKHNANHKGFTGGNSDWVIKYVEEFNSKAAAMKREREIKGCKSRLNIQQLFATE